MFDQAPAFAYQYLHLIFLLQVELKLITFGTFAVERNISHITCHMQPYVLPDRHSHPTNNHCSPATASVVSNDSYPIMPKCVRCNDKLGNAQLSQTNYQPFVPYSQIFTSNRCVWSNDKNKWVIEALINGNVGVSCETRQKFICY